MNAYMRCLPIPFGHQRSAEYLSETACTVRNLSEKQNGVVSTVSAVSVLTHECQALAFLIGNDAACKATCMKAEWLQACISGWWQHNLAS